MEQKCQENVARVNLKLTLGLEVVVVEINAVKKQIKNCALDKFYVFTGEEIEAQRIYVNKIAEVTGRTVCRLDTVAEVLKQRSGLIRRPTVYVVRDDKDFMQAEKAWGDIEDLLGDRLLIFQVTVLDKRTKFYSFFKDKVVTFNYMDAEVLYKYTQKEVALSDENTEKLISLCRNSYGRILLETDKIRQYVQACCVAPDEAFRQLVEDGTINRPPEDAIFDFVDAVLQADPHRAYMLLEDCKAIGEPSLRLISVLYTNVKRVLQVQTCASNDICQSTGLSQWDVKCAKKNLNYWNGADLVSFLKTLQKIERGIKTGEVEEAVAVEYALSHMF